jgi:hypothetical protein
MFDIIAPDQMRTEIYANCILHARGAFPRRAMRDEYDYDCDSDLDESEEADTALEIGSESSADEKTSVPMAVPDLGNGTQEDQSALPSLSDIDALSIDGSTWASEMISPVDHSTLHPKPEVRTVTPYERVLFVPDSARKTYVLA